MTPVREAFTLPLIFLTVVLLGGIRAGADVRLVPPTLFSLVLATMLCGALVQSGTVAATRLVGPSRTRAANVNGIVVLLTMFVATAQAFTLMTPESGVPSVVFSLFFLVMLAQVLAAALDRLRLLRVLAVALGAAFTLKFIVLAALSAPAETRVARAVQLLFEGVTLGTVSQAPAHPATGYLAFGALALYLVGILLLPGAGWVSIRSVGAARISDLPVLDARDRTRAELPD